MDLSYPNERKLFAIAAVISAIFWLLLIVGTIGIALIYLLIGFIIYLFAQSAFISHVKGNGVRVTVEQYRDLYDSLVKCCQRVGVEEEPEMYLLRTDFFNALATRFLGRNFIVLFTDVVDALEDEPGAIDFYIGHELGHIHRKHLKWTWFLFPALLLPLLGAAYRRAEEYTCDRYGAACCETDDQVRAALAAISAGNTRWKDLNHAAYLEQIPVTRGFWMSFHELTGDYPWLTKRMASALAFRRKEQVRHPRRNFFAWILALFVPRLGVGGGAVSLVLTIAIIGILAAIAIPAYQDFTARAEVAASIERSAPLRSAIEQYVATEQALPSSLADLGLDAGVFATPSGLYEIGVYDDGMIGITLGESATGEPAYLVFEPRVEDGRIEWICYGQNARQILLPSACQN